MQLVSLPAGSRVFLQHILSPLTVNDCGPAEIFGQYLENGRLTVNGATHAKTGFLGVSNSMQGGSDGTNYDILVDDNQDLVIGHMYNEGSKNHLKANRGAGTGSGRITIQGVKQNVQSGTCTSILVNNYQGRVLYGPTCFANSAATLITQTGTNLVDLILPGVMFNTCAPTLTTATTCNFIQTQNIYGTAPVTYPADVIPTGGMASIAAGFDHLRQLWAEDLKLIHGIQNVAINSFFETDPINPSPLTTMGTTPASWVVSGGTATGTGVRNMSVVAPASPFSSGTQCASFVDTTGTNAGSRLAFGQTPVLLPASCAAVFSFDVRLNSMASLNDDVYVRLWSGAVTAHNIHLTANNTSAAYGPAPLALNTWYRIRAVIPAPGLGGTKTITLYVTPWNGTAPGATIIYSGITGSSGSATSGFTSIYFNQTNPGANTNINFDNITLVSGDPLLPH